jgi:TP901 family phage tail tape measure protein
MQGFDPQETITYLLQAKTDLGQVTSEIAKLEKLVSKPMALNLGSSQNYADLQKELVIRKAINEEQIKHLNNMRKNSELSSLRKIDGSQELSSMREYYSKLEQVTATHQKVMENLQSKAAYGSTNSPRKIDGSQELKEINAYYKSLEDAATRHSKAMGSLGVQDSTKDSNTASKGGGTFSTSSLGGTVSANVQASLKDIPPELEKVSKATNKVRKDFMDAMDSGTTFGHKVGTTMQYMAAGAGIMAVATGVKEFASAVIEADKALGMFEAVLELSSKQAKVLQENVYATGTTYGGTIQELNDTALALGRAGIASDKLATGIQAVSQLALISGESLGTVTDVMVSWETLYSTSGYNLSQLGDIIVKVANESKASVADFNTMSTYILTAGQQAGLTAEALASMAGAWKQIGKGSSTSGTEIRRFFNQLETGSKDVRAAYDKLNISVDKLRKGLSSDKLGESDATMVALFEHLSKISDKEGQKAIEGIGEVLDKATIKSLLAISKSGKDGLNEFLRILRSAKDSEGAAKEAADRVALTYEKMWERIKNSMSHGSIAFNEEFKKAFAGPDKTVDDFSSKLEAFDRVFSRFSGALGESLGGAATDIMDIAVGLERVYDVLQTSGPFDKWEIGLAAIIAATIRWNQLLMANPIIMAAAVGIEVLHGAQIFTETQSIKASDEVSKQSNKMFDQDVKAINKKATAQERILVITKALATAEKQLDTVFAKRKGDTREGSTSDIDARAKIDEISRLNKLLKAYKEGTTSKAKSEVKVDIAGNTPPPPDTKGIEKEENQAYRNMLAKAKLTEELYFDNKNITSEFEKQQYHINVTNKYIDEQSEKFKGIKTLEDNLAKDSASRVHDQNTLNTLTAEYREAQAKATTTLLQQREAIGYMTEERKIQLEQSIAEDQAKETLRVALAKLGTLDEQKGERDKARALFEQSLLNAKLTAETKLEKLNRSRTEELQKQRVELEYRQKSFALEYDQYLGYNSLQTTYRKAELDYIKTKGDLETAYNNSKIDQELKIKALETLNTPEANTEIANIRAAIDLKYNALVKELELNKEIYDTKQAMTQLAIDWKVDVKPYDDLSTSVAGLVTGFAALGQRNAEFNLQQDNLVKITEDSNASTEKRINAADDLKRSETEQTKSNVNGVMDVLSANKKMLKEKTFAYKAIEVMEKARFAYDMYTTVTTIANSLAKAGAFGAEAMAAAGKGVATQASLPFPYNLAAMAATAAALGAMGLFSGGGSGGTAVAPPSATQGTVLGGGAYGQSESITNISTLLEDIHASEYSQLRDINRAVTSMAAGIEGAITNIFRSGILDTSSVGLASKAGSSEIWKSLGESFMGDFALGSINAKLTDFVFGGSSKQSIRASGFEVGAGTLASKQQGSTLGASSYVDVETNKRGLFGSHSYSYDKQSTALDETSANAIALIYKSFSDTMLEINKGLGTNLADDISGYTLDAMSLNLKGLTGEESVQALNDYYSALGDTVTADIFGPAIEKYADLGEGLLETAIRLISQKEVAIQSLGDIGFDTSGFKHFIDVTTTELLRGPEKLITGVWGQVFYAIGDVVDEVTKITPTLVDDTIAITDSLVGLAGGLTQFQDAQAIYYDKYFTDAEKQVNTYRHLSEEFSNFNNETTDLGGAMLNLEMPTTVQGFRDLVSSLDLTTEEGQKAYTMLLGVADAFFNLKNPVEEERKGLQEQLNLLTGVTTQRELELNALDSTNRALQTQIWLEEDRQKVIEKASKALDSILGTISPSNNIAYKSSQDQLLRMVGSGIIPSLEAFDKAIAGVSNNDMGNYSSMSAYLRDQKITANALAAIGGIDVSSLDVEKSMLVELQSQTSSLIAINGALQDRNQAVYVPQVSSSIGYVTPNSTAMQSNGGVLEELKMLRAEVRAVVDSTFKIARILQDVTPNKTSIDVGVVA